MNGAADRPLLLQRLAADAVRFDFFQAVRLLLRGHARLDQRRRGAGPASLRFRSHLSFQFKASDVQAIRPPADPDQPVEVVVNFLGIASPGVIGSLPNWYAETALAEARHRDLPNAAVADFFALFDDRLVQLYFRAWLRNNLPVQYELQRDGFLARLLLSVVGFGTPGLAELLPFAAKAFVPHAAVLARRPATAAGLAQALAGWFDVPFAVEPFVEFAAELAPEQRLRLGDAAMRLGETTVLGDSVRMRQAKFRLRAGPLRWTQFVAFLPGRTPADDGPMLRDLMAWVRQAVGAEFEYDLQLVLRADDVPVLAFRSDEPARSRLGMSMWLGARLQGGDATDTLVPVSMLEGRTVRAPHTSPSAVRPRAAAS